MSWLIRAQADEFFNAYQVLLERGLEMNGSAVVNLAFSLELYIKELHVILLIKENKGDKDKIKAPRGHNILELFRKLPKNVQQEIRRYPDIKALIDFYSLQTPLYIPQDRKKQPVTDTLEQEIFKISDAFQKWRYAYESRSLHYEKSTALILIEAIRSVSDNERKCLIKLKGKNKK